MPWTLAVRPPENVPLELETRGLVTETAVIVAVTSRLVVAHPPVIFTTCMAMLRAEIAVEDTYAVVSPGKSTETLETSAPAEEISGIADHCCVCELKELDA